MHLLFEFVLSASLMYCIDYNNKTEDSGSANYLERQVLGVWGNIMYLYWLPGEMLQSLRKDRMGPYIAGSTNHMILSRRTTTGNVFV